MFTRGKKLKAKRQVKSRENDLAYARKRANFINIQGTHELMGKGHE